MDVKQIRLSKMATFCYMVGDAASGACALIDPAFDTDKLLSIAKDAGYRVIHVINTHRHPDHCAGNAAIIAATGARLAIHEIDAPYLGKMLNGFFSRVIGGKPSTTPDILLTHNSRIPIGKTTLTVLHTPGHTPGSICLYTPGHVFTGDTLFVGAVGRTDLPGGSAAELLASVREQIYTLPDATTVWPGHDYGQTPSSTVGFEKKTNPFIQ
ncbi:MAG: MBL fold metallo-hydrolase [Thermodesulfobacteriota bacterium]|nr:MBL fold metallo-hydrolase [Thermodesulfobacteriota bacterium]